MRHWTGATSAHSWCLINCQTPQINQSKLKSCTFPLTPLQIEVDEDDIDDRFKSLFGKLSGKVCYSCINLNIKRIVVLTTAYFGKICRRQPVGLKWYDFCTRLRIRKCPCLNCKRFSTKWWWRVSKVFFFSLGRPCSMLKQHIINYIFGLFYPQGLISRPLGLA